MSIVEDEKGRCCETDYLNWCMQNGWRVIKPAYKYHPGSDLWVNDKLVQIKGQIPWWTRKAFTFSKEQYYRYMKMSQVPEVIFYDVDNLRVQRANLLQLADLNAVFFEKQKSKDEDIQACIPMNQTTFLKRIDDEWTLKEIIRLWGKEIQYNKKFKKQGDCYAL